ncbi:hypothetical protein J4377_13480 [Halomonas sp. XH26]|uniref:hypothetical protein n=1 Tax=Halomonas sp. XH26 TaxID=2557993 RepID=UPI00209F6D48|nr:hypothetical protein [Halomonas sp. XH26]UTA78964.1 hypothetical protein J4377_13480 [Halomonas sp. XH26]
MKLTLNLSPVRVDEQPTRAALSGTVLTVNHRGYDLSELPDGATAEHPELGKVTRNGDEYECTVRLGHGPNAPYETRFPEPIVLDNHNGPIELPLYDVVPEEDEVIE